MIVANSVAAGYAMLKVDREGGMKSGCEIKLGVNLNIEKKSKKREIIQKYSWTTSIIWCG